MSQFGGEPHASTRTSINEPLGRKGRGGNSQRQSASRPSRFAVPVLFLTRLLTNFAFSR
jgi:hypothetical protein